MTTGMSPLSRPRPRWLRGVTTGAALAGMLGLIGAVTRAQSLPAVTLAASATQATTGQTVIFTAHALQVTHPEYAWWAEAPGGTWQEVAPYSDTSTYALTDVQPGSYLVRATVDAASAVAQGGTAPEATSAVSTLLVGSQLTLTASAATITPGQPLTLTATAHQVSHPVYQFWVRNPAGVWSSSGGFTYTVTPHTVGTYLAIAYTEPAGSAMAHPLPSAVLSIGSQPTMFLNGPTAPTTAIGVIGDMYLDTATETLYGPKTPTGWGSPVGLVGPRGPVGARGATGGTGPAGPSGATGPRGPQGLSASACQVTLGSTTYTSLASALAQVTAGATDTLVVTGICAGGVTIPAATLTLEGLPMAAVSGGGTVLTISNGATVTFDNLIVTGGTNSGIVNNGTLTLTGATQVDRNSSTSSGGGIVNGGDLTLDDMAQVDNNTASTSGAYGGGIFTRVGVVTLNDMAQVDNNAAAGQGGGIANFGTLNLNGVAQVDNNRAPMSPGILGGWLTTGTPQVNDP